LGPIQARRVDLLADPGAVSEVLARGAERAGAIASVTYARAASAVGLLHP